MPKPPPVPPDPIQRNIDITQAIEQVKRASILGYTGEEEPASPDAQETRHSVSQGTNLLGAQETERSDAQELKRLGDQSLKSLGAQETERSGDQETKGLGDQSLKRLGTQEAKRPGDQETERSDAQGLKRSGDQSPEYPGDQSLRSVSAQGTGSRSTKSTSSDYEKQSVYLTKGLRRWLQIEAATTRKEISDIVEEALQAYRAGQEG